ncbi:UTRA domain-containing protein [Streptomyces bobili]|uniref:UTRA domain-containing protein n=1 Tax=Streptomyces bobili TaxID=67280 RepID=UPI0036FB7B57
MHAGEVPAPADVAGLLGITEGDPVVVRRQLVLLDNRPNELADTYYPTAIARGTGLARTAKIPGGAVTLLAMNRRRIKGGTPALLTELGHPPRRSVDRVSARIPTQEQYQALHLTSNMPVLRTLRVLHSDRDVPVEVTVMVKAGHLYELQYEFGAE